MKSIPYGCDYDMQVYNASGSSLGGSFSAENQDETFGSIITAPGKYYVRVYSYTGSNASDTYELKAGVYTPDQYEVNDDIYNVNSQNWSVMSLNSCIYGTIDNQDDVDYYKFTLANSTNVGIRLQNIPSAIDFDLIVYTYSNGNFTEVGRSTNGSNADETIISQLAAGSYFVKAYSYWGSSENQSYKLSIYDENAGVVSMVADKNTANVGDVITVQIKADGFTNIAGYQANLKYDPAVVMPVDFTDTPFDVSTYPMYGNILINPRYSPFPSAMNNLNSGILSFGTCYMNIDGYKEGGVAESNGTLAIIRFKVLKENQIKLQFESTPSMPGSLQGVAFYDWYGNTLKCNVNQILLVNEGLPVNAQAVISSNVEEDKGVRLEAFSEYTISGYIKPDVNSNNQNIKEGFKVEIEGTSANGVTDSNGYFQFSFSTEVCGDYKIILSKPGYLKRYATVIAINSNIAIGTLNEPVEMWPGDLNKDADNIAVIGDGAINVADVIELAKTFLTVSTDIKFESAFDLNLDKVINIADVIIMASHFNASGYDAINIYPNTKEYVDVAVDNNRAIALKADGTVWEFKGAPVKIDGLSDIKAIACCDIEGFLAIKKDGTVWKCYGANNCPERFYDLTNVKKISAGFHNTLYLTDNGTLYSTGSMGHLGIARDDSLVGWISKPNKVQGLPPDKKVIDMDCGLDHSLVLLEDGTVWGFGENTYGQLGNTVLDTKYTAIRVSDLSGVKSVAAGCNKSFALKSDGTLLAWGQSNWLGLGRKNGEIIITPTVVQESSALKFKSIYTSVGFENSAAIKEDGSLWVWGYNSNTDLGYGEGFPDNAYEPTKLDIRDVKDVYLGSYQSFVLKNDGSIWGWGYNSNGCLGVGNLSYQSTPVMAGTSHYCDLSDIYIVNSNDYSAHGMDLFNPDSTEYTMSPPKNTTLPLIEGKFPTQGSTIECTNKQVNSIPGTAEVLVTSKLDNSLTKAYKINFLNSSSSFYRSVKGEIDFPGDYDIYKVYLEGGKLYNIYSTGNTDTYLEERDYSGNVLTSVDDTIDDTNFRLGLKPSLYSSGIYYFVVSHFDKVNGTGEYTLHISDIYPTTLNADQLYLKDLVDEWGGKYTRIGDTALVEIDNYSGTFNNTNSTIINSEIVVTLTQFYNTLSQLVAIQQNTEIFNTPDDSVIDLANYKDDDRNTMGNVTRLQQVLKALGCWVNPDGTVYRGGTTGFYGNVTKASVEKFKNLYMDSNPNETNVGIKTANELTEYRKMYYLSKTNIKPDGVKVREYIDARLKDKLGGTYTIGYKNGFVTISRFGQEPENLVISNMTNIENKCYAQVRHISWAIDNFLRVTQGYTDIVVVKQNMEKLMSPTVALYNGGGRFVVTNLRNSSGQLDAYWDNKFNVAVTNFIEASKLWDAYAALKSFKDKALFLKHWTNLDLIKENIYINPAPPQWYSNMQNPPVIDPVYGKITADNKEKCKSASDYYMRYHYVIDRVRNWQSPTLGMKDVWMQLQYGISGADKGGIIAGIVDGVIGAPIETVAGIFTGIQAVVKDPKAAANGIGFLFKAICLPAPLGMDEKILLSTMIAEMIKAYAEEFVKADSYEKGKTIGSAIAFVLTFFVSEVAIAKTAIKMIGQLKEAKVLTNFLRRAFRPGSVASDVAKTLKRAAEAGKETFYSGYKNYEKLDYWAEKAYDFIRGGSPLSTKALARAVENLKGTGFNASEIEQIMRHVFIEEHNIFGETMKFVPDQDLAYMWLRAIQGNLTETELSFFKSLMTHELKESNLMKGGTPFRYIEKDMLGAHDIAGKVDEVCSDFNDILQLRDLINIVKEILD